MVTSDSVSYPGEGSYQTNLVTIIREVSPDISFSVLLSFSRDSLKTEGSKVLFYIHYNNTLALFLNKYNAP